MLKLVLFFYLIANVGLLLDLESKCEKMQVGPTITS